MAALRERFALAPDAEVTLEANPGTVDLGVPAGAAGRRRQPHQLRRPVLPRRRAGGAGPHPLGGGSGGGVPLGARGGLPARQPRPDLRPARSSLSSAGRRRWSGRSPWRRTTCRSTPSRWRRGRSWPTTSSTAASRSRTATPRRRCTSGRRSGWRRRATGSTRSPTGRCPGQECRHNLVYWRNGDWLGLGAGAHSHLGGLRFADVYSPRRYVQLVGETAQAPPEDPDAGALVKRMRQVTFVEEPRPELARADTLILGLRLNEGVSLPEFRRRFGRRRGRCLRRTFEEFASLGLLERANGRLRLTAARPPAGERGVRAPAAGLTPATG